MKKLLLILVLSVLSGCATNGAITEAEDREKFVRLAPLAAQGNAIAQTKIGQMYEDGEGVTQDYKKALKWYRLAAAQWNYLAQTQLGYLYYYGEGVIQDYREAVKWFLLAAEQGFVVAQDMSGVMYTLGRGVPKDYVRAHMWLNLAVSNGSSEAGKLREMIAKKMTPSQIAKAQEMARECEKKKYKNCSGEK